MKKRYRVLFVIVLFALLMSNLFLLAKYRSAVNGTSTVEVAKWDNNIEIVGSNEFILDNGETNSVSLTFNLLSSSEVTSKYDICFNNINKIVALELSNLSKSGSVKIDGNYITITFDSDEETFTIPSTTTSSTSGNITMNSTVISGGIDLRFTKAGEEMNIYVKVNTNDYYDVHFNKFGTMNHGNNQSITHNVIFSTENVQLPGSNAVELYGVFEQID